MAGEVQQIVEGGSLSDRPEVLTAEALKPSGLSIAEQIRLNRSSASPKRGPGRPPGSKNRPRVEVLTPEEEETRKAENEAKRIRALVSKSDTKKKKVEDLTNRIVGDMNDTIMLAFISMGVPSAVLYRDGKAPVKTVNTNYTPIANQLAVQPMQAKAIASFMVDLEYVDQDSKLAGLVSSATGGTAGLVFKGLIAAGAAAMYIRGVMSAMQQLGPVIQQLQEYQQRAAAANAMAHQQAQGAGV